MSLFLSDKIGKIVLAAFITANVNQGVVFPDQGMALVIVLLCGADKGADRLRFFVLSEKDLSPPFAPPRTVIFCRFLRIWGKQKIPISLGNQDFTVFCFSSKWCHQESNRGHKDFQSFALPTELWHHCFLFAVAKVRKLLKPANFSVEKMRFLCKKRLSVCKMHGCCTKKTSFSLRRKVGLRKGRSYFPVVREFYPFNGFQPCAFSSSSLPSRVTSAQPSSGLVI